MSLMKSIKEMVRAGQPHKQAIASALAGKRKEKMMSQGGMVEERDLTELQLDGNYYPSEVENPEEMDEAQGFAKALRRQAMSVMSPENYAMGGLVEAGPAEDEELHGNHPEDITDRPESEEPMSDEPMKASSMEHKMMETGTELSMEAQEAIARKRRSRKYGFYDPSNG